MLVNSPDLFECYVPYTGFTSLASSADVVWLIGAEIARANGDLSRAEQIKAFRDDREQRLIAESAVEVL